MVWKKQNFPCNKVSTDLDGTAGLEQLVAAASTAGDEQLTAAAAKPGRTSCATGAADGDLQLLADLLAAEQLRDLLE